MALVAEPSVVDSVMSTSTSTSTEGLADLENEAESMSVSSSDLSSCEVDVQGETVEMENDTSSIDESPKEPESVQEALQVEDVDSNSNEGKGQKEAVLVEVALPGPGPVPEPAQSVTLDEVEVTATMVVVDNEVITGTGADEENVSTSEVPIPDPVPMETQTEDEEVTIEKDKKSEDCTEIVVVEDETSQVVTESENPESGTADEVGTAGDVEADLSVEDEDEDNSKENKENEAVEPSEGQIILTGATSIVSDPALTPTEVDLVAEAETTPTSTSDVAVTVESEAPPPVDDDDDVRVVDADEIDLTLASPLSNKSVQVSTSTSEIEIPENKNSDSDKPKLTDDECPETLALVDPKLELGTGVVKPKIEDVENNINKIIHKSQSSKDGETSAQEIKNELGDQIRSMMRGDLETLIVDKIIEAIAIHSNVGVLNQKLHQANAQKDRLFHKISNLQRQVTELSKAVRSVSENVGRNQKTVNKTNQPIRFYRSVGVQVFLEGPINPPPQSRSLSQPEFPKPMLMEPKKSVLKSGNNNTPSSLIPQHSSPLKPVPGQVPLSTILNGNVHPALKRTMAKPSISVAEVARQIDIQNKVRKVGNGNGSPAPPVTSTPPKINSANGVGINSKSPLRASPGMQQQPQQQQHHNMVMRNPAAAMATKVLNLNGGGPMLQIQGGSNTVSMSKTGTGSIEPGIVDLTDDDAVVTSSNSPPKKTVPPATATTASSLMLNGKNNTNNNVVPFQNGVQYRLVSQGPQYQLVQNGANYHIVTSGNQTRPVFVSPMGSAPKMGAQVRPVAAQSISLLRGLVPGSQGNVGGPININAGGQIMMRPMVASAAAKQQTNAVTPMMVKQQQFQQQGLGQQMSMVARQQQQQGVNQVNANKAMTNNPVGLRIPNQTVRPMGQVPRVNTRAAVDALKKFILPPLPPPAIVGNPRRCSKDIPPRPDLNLTEQEQGIVLSWTLKLGPNHAEIQTYQIYACQEPLFNNPKSGSWKRVGDVKALPLPMACTLSQFTDENRYHFIVRGVDVYNRTGPFCEAAAITLKKK